MTPEYRAGIIDGEGHIRTAESNYRYHYPRITVVNTFRPLLEQIQAAYGGAVLCHDSKRTTRNPKWSDCWKWDTSGKNAIVILNAVLPFLIVKREAALAALGAASQKAA